MPRPGLVCDWNPGAGGQLLGSSPLLSALMDPTPFEAVRKSGVPRAVQGMAKLQCPQISRDHGAIPKVAFKGG